MTFPCGKYLIGLLICFTTQLSLFSLTQAQSAPSPSEKTQTAPAQKAKEADYSQEAFVLEKLRTLYRFEKDGTGQREQTVRVKLQSEAALEQFGQLVLSYVSANEKLDIDYVRVRKADGTAVAASASDVQDLTAPISREAPIYTDLRQKHVTVPGLRPGDVLEYHVIWQLHTPLAPNHFWLDYDFITRNLIVLDEQLEVNIPSESTVKLKTEKDFEPTIKEAEGRRIYSWKHALLKREEANEDDKEARRKRREEIENPKPPTVQLTTFKSWDEVGQWYAGLERDRIVPDDRVRAKVQELVQNRATDRDKIQALYEFVARNFRYVSLSLGQSRYQPHAASDVLANQYGDCKDKHTLLSSMLLAAGLRAYPALMNSSRKIDPDVPSPAQFDHVITAIQSGGETLWADTTAEVAPFRLLAPSLRDKKALVIPANAPARLETTPAEPPFLSTEIVELQGEVNDLGQLKGHAHLTLRGDSEMEFRKMFRRTSKSDWKQLGFVLSMAVGVRGEATEIKTSDLAALDKPFEVEFDFSSNDFLDWSSKKAKLNIPMPRLSLPGVDPDKDESSSPIQLGAPIDTTYKLKLTLPAKYQANAPVPMAVTRDYANYRSQYKLEGNVLLAERSYRLRQHELPAARAQDYSAFVAATRSDEGQTVSVETAIVAGASAISDSLKVEDLISAAGAASNNQNYPLAEEILKRVLEKEPTHKTARRQLGWVLFSQFKFDAAAEVLNQQTKLNPFDDYAYNLLGQVYWRQQKYAEAESALRKQIEVTPLDKWAHGVLGLMLVEWRKYKEAVPELEQAVSLNPEQEAQYQISLGRAYMNLRQTDKATQAFERAVKLEPGQRTWNDVAYFLAESKVQLDKAQQYAESAVTEVSTELRNVELNRLTLNDLRNVSALSAYWDTLGWVHFQKGDVDAAEKYIAGAWALQQHGEVGYHLGQIFEKRGKKEEAIQMYALSAVAYRTVPEVRESLDRLAGREKSEAFLKKASDESRDSRTIKLGSLATSVKASGEAQFYVALVPGASGVAQVSEVKFIRGDEKLRTLESALKSAKYNLAFPDGTSAKVIRRGTLYCLANRECSFIMMSPDLISSVE